MSLVVAVPRETAEREQRVAMVPALVAKLAEAGASVRIESGAGRASDCPDNAYDHAEVVPGDRLFDSADVVLGVAPPAGPVLKGLKEGAVVMGFLDPYNNRELVEACVDRKLTSFAMELIPRISRAQSMDALSSQAAVAGYKGAVLAANHAGYFFPMLTTAAGTVRPAKVLVIGAGVAGLQAIATCRRLGAQVTGYDVRPETEEQVESLGARFLKLDVGGSGEGGYARELNEEEQARQQDKLAEAVSGFNIVISTAAVPGKPAPKILTQSMVEGMTPGSVIVDLGAEGGGNCELTRPGEVVETEGVVIDGPLNLPSRLARHASELYARNLWNFLKPVVSDGELNLDFDDEVIAGSCLTHDGQIRNEAIRERFQTKGADND